MTEELKRARLQSQSQGPTEGSETGFTAESSSIDQYEIMSKDEYSENKTQVYARMNFLNNFVCLFSTITILILFYSSTTSGGGYTNIVNNGLLQSVHDEFNDRKDVTMKTITVDKSGKGNFTTVQQAIDSVPDNNLSWLRIHVKAGTYTEKVYIKYEKQYIFLEGDSSQTTTIAWGDSGDVDKSPTFSSYADNIVASKITFKNFYNFAKSKDDYYYGNGKAVTWAPAALIVGDKVSFYSCSFISVQDTLFDASGRHYFKYCYIEGAIDFIFGNAQSYYQKCILNVSTSSLGPGRGGCITAQGRESWKQTTGFVFVSNVITGIGPTILGRAYRSHSRVLFYKTYMNNIVSPEGWNSWYSKGHE
ncbi:probable pectinesterase 29 [Humulus lupulus]|uniref:probable pectinesterase 29 n=1 Tax=Humulus lupulus TaxID=3486 RepID=UPI002B401869|nr:probable pectinesterase 29 [Humulus lupulus]